MQEITPTQPILVTDVILQITMQQLIQLMQQLNFRPTVSHVTQKMHGLLLHLIMMLSISQFTVVHIKADGIHVLVVILSPVIMPYLPVLHQHAIAVRIIRIREVRGAMIAIREGEEMIKRLNTIFILGFFLFGSVLIATGQEPTNMLEGTVSYLAGTNIYVKFV